MLPEGSSLAERAYRHVVALANTIGPRPAGSAAEAQAQQYVHTELSRLGLGPQSLPVSFAPLPRFFPYTFLSGIALILAAWGVDIAPGLSIWLPVLTFALPQVSRWANRRLPRTEISQNVLAYTSPELPGASSLILCAHVDSARAIALRSPIWLHLYHRTLDIVQRVVFLIVGLAIIRQLGIA